MRLLFLTLLISTQGIAQNKNWTSILKTYVSDAGTVNYKLLHNKPEQLNTYLNTLAEADMSAMSMNAQKALWMNAYNAYTLKVILDHYPLKSITDIKIDGKTAWELPIAKVAGKTYTLNQIEHEILRKEFNDYRIHAGINCASFSCPVLLNQPFTEANVNQLLDVAFRGFVNDPQRNKISKDALQLSQLFEWFAEDFKKDGGVLAVVKKYADTPVSANAKISYLKYNWSLNGQS
jgi:hypothetical protein